jgi:transposase
VSSNKQIERILALYQTYSAGVIAELLGLSRGKVQGIIDRARHPTRNLRPRQRRGRKPVPCYKHKTRFTRWLPPEGGMFQRGG